MSGKRAWTLAAALSLGLALPVAAAQGASAAEGVDLGGTPVTDASTDPRSPTQLAAGLWADRLGGLDTPEEIHHFRYVRTIADSTVHIGVIGASKADDGDALEVVTEAGGEDCGSADSTAQYPVEQATFGASVAVGPSDAGVRDTPCVEETEIDFTVGRGISGADAELPVAIKIVEEAPLTSAPGSLPTSPETPRYQPPAAGGPTDKLSGATSLADAPVLRSGTTYAGEVAEGEERLYQVRLEWGQALSARVAIPRKDLPDEATDFVDPGVELTVIDPMRDTFSDELDGEEPSGNFGDEPIELGVGTPPVAYLNRFDDLPASLPGDYWVSVAVQPADDRDPVVVPVELTVEVTGEPAGAPTYPDTVPGPGGTAGPEGYDPSTPYLVGEGQFSADPSGNPLPAADEADASWWGPRRIGGIALGVLSLGCCVVGGLRLRRR